MISDTVALDRRVGRLETEMALILDWILNDGR